MLGRIRLSQVGIWVGLILTGVGFWAYGQGNSTLNLAGFFYGLPLLLGGLALKSSELEPVPFTQVTSPEVLALREQQATTTQTKLRKDVTRYCYGQDAHLDIALKYLGLAPKDDDDIPRLKGLREESREGAYTLILEFDSPEVGFSAWQAKQEQMNKYFGPDIQAELVQPEENQVELALCRILA